MKKISLIIPCYNEEEISNIYLKILKNLVFKNLEIVLVDNGLKI